MRVFRAVLLLLAFLGASCGAPEVPPNVVVILVDDLGYCDSGLYGCDSVPTPSIKRIAEAGVLFTAGYVTSPVCSPSRAGLLTGRYQQRFGHEYLPSSDAFGLPIGEETLADAMKAAGYKTGIVGKWHLGVRDEFHPLRRGFDEFFGVLDSATDYADPSRGDLRGVRPAHKNTASTTPDSVSAWQRKGHRAILRGTEPVREREYLTEAITRESVEFISRHKNESFFLYVPYNAVHGPLQVTQTYYDRFPHIQDESTRIYAAMITALDDGVGEVLDALESHGLESNTLVVFLSDNGAGVADYCSNEPLRLGKQTLFEGGVRVPFAMRWPAKIAAGTMYDHPVSAVDVFPTAMAATGRALEQDITRDGVDLLPHLETAASDPPHESLYWRSGDNWAVRTGDWKLIYAGGQYWLYDLSADVGEVVNLAAEKLEIVRTLRSAYEEWNREMIDPLWPPIGVKSLPQFAIDGVSVEWPV